MEPVNRIAVAAGIPPYVKNGVGSKDRLQGISPYGTLINQGKVVLRYDAVLVMLHTVLKLNCRRGGAKVGLRP